MKARLENISLAGKNASFLCYEVNVPAFEFVWHYHPEYELTYIMGGSGERLVGDNYAHFEPGDLVLLGPMLPHTWVGKTSDNEHCRAVVIQFSKAFIEPLLHYPEIAGVVGLLGKAAKGLFFTKVDRDTIGLLKACTSHTGVDTFITLVKILCMLANAEAMPLSFGHVKPFKGNEDQHRINKVFTYLHGHSSDGVSIAQAAALVHLSESAFCKFFKRISGKTFSDYVNDVRIAKACQLLIETDKPIEEVAFAVGFESQTYFNRVFLKKKATKPTIYRALNAFR